MLARFSSEGWLEETDEAAPIIILRSRKLSLSIKSRRLATGGAVISVV